MCKLGDVVEHIKRKNKGLESTLALTISAQYGLLAQKDFFQQEVASKDVSNYYLVKNGEFAYNKSYSKGYPWGAVKRLENYEMGVLSTLYIVFKPINIDSGFLAQYYETTHWHNEVAQYAAEGARNHGLLNIATSDFFDTMLTMPTNSNEQAVIEDFFLMLDGQIMAQEQKLSQLKQLKSAYLQKMFV
ncbi:restriction endonuclease subunit S domain-containing protein, partial [Lacrimispora brassicae]